MSDIREAREALNKYRKAYDEMYQMLGIFLDADEGLGKPDIDEAWAAFNRAPGPVYWKAIEAALSANGGEAVTPVWDNKVLVSNIVRAFWRRIYTYKDRYPAKELPREVPIELYFAMSTALMHLDNESLNPKHPAPPSAAVPEGWKLVPIEPSQEQREASLYHNDMFHTSGTPEDMNCDIYRAMLTAAPFPDHSGDEFQRGFEAGKKAIIDGGRERIMELEDHIADAGKVAFVDGLGAQRMTAEECKEGIEYIIHGDNIYWPLSDDDELRLIQAACGKGEFTYPSATPSVPENEVKARGFEEYANLLETEAHDLGEDDLSQSELLMDSALDARSYATRLRTAGDEGEE